VAKKPEKEPKPVELSEEELEAEEASELPEREAMSLVDPGVSTMPIYHPGLEGEPVYGLPYERPVDMSS